MARITWANKIALIVTGLLHVNVWKDADANELKGASDNHDGRLDDLEQGLINEVVNVSAIWTGTGLNYNVSADNFGGAEGGKEGYFSATADVVTLTVADGSDERIDRIGVFYPVAPATLGIVGKVDGIPGSGIAEDYDPTLFFHIRFATVEALATTPKDTVNETVYTENAGEPGEWVASDNTANIVQNSTNDPDVGTVSIEGTNVVKGNKNIFTHSTVFSTADFDLLTYRTKLKASMGNSSWYIKFFNSTTLIGSEYRFRNGQNNFVSTDISGYQSIRIDLAKLNLPVADFDIMQIYTQKSFAGYFIDEVYLYKGSGSDIVIISGVGDMLLAAVQVVTGAKTFNNAKLLFRNVANTFSSYFTNINTAVRVYILQDKSGTIAHLNDTKKIYNVKDHGALGDGIDGTDGAITAVDATFTSALASFVAGDVGKVVSIEGAGTAGAYHVTTVASFTSGTEVELTDNAVTTVSGVIYRYGTDDTSALQTLIQTVYDAGGGIPYFLNGIYIIDGPLLNNIGPDLIDYNSQLYIPDSDVDLPTRPSIEFLGEVQPNLMQSGGLTAFDVPPLTGVILYSTIQGSGTRPSVIANRGASDNIVADISDTTVKFTNLQIQVTPDANNKATMGYINCEYSLAANLDYCTGYPYNLDLFDSGEPDVIDIVGFSMPKVNTEWVSTVRNCTVGGVTHGYTAGDHTSFYDATAVVCVNGFTQDINHGISTYVKISAFWCINDFNVNGASIFNVVSFQNEWSSQGKWFDNVYTINDASDLGVGTINWNVAEKDVGYNPDKFMKNGGDKIKTNPIGVNDLTNTQSGTTYTFKILDAYRLTESTNASATSFTVPPDATLNFDLGATIPFGQNAAGQLTIVAGSGVTIHTPETLKLRKQYSMGAVVKKATNVWQITGDLELV